VLSGPHSKSPVRLFRAAPRQTQGIRAARPVAVVAAASNLLTLFFNPYRVYTPSVHLSVHIFCTYYHMNVNVTELRQNLPAYLKRVRQGERIRVTSRGQIVAELAPPTASADEVALARKKLRGSVVRYDTPFEPAFPVDDWMVNK
jgi:antitoxin (DNA-binding transcriptional repressor) of toxin-antitoxin stability system